MSRLSPDVQAALTAATVSEDGLSLTLAGQLDRKVYTATAKAIEALGGKWNRKAGAHLFTTDVRVILAGVLGGDKLPDKNPLDFFATPEPVIHEMLKRLWPWPDGSRFLEPSAGEGALVDLLHARHGVYADCCELHEGRAHTTRAKGYPVVGGDFLQFKPEQPYDYVLMNPPFTATGDPLAYITHIEHALTCLRPGGELVAVVPAGYVFNERKRVATFRAFCEEHQASPVHKFDPGAFKASGTEIATCLIHIQKSEEAAMPSTTKKPRQKAADTAMPTTDMDFKKMAEETRAKMQASAKPAALKRRAAVERISHQRADYVSYHVENRYIISVVAEVLEDGYRLELPQESPVNGAWTVLASPEQVTPRALRPLHEYAPLVIGDRVEREVASSEPLPIKGICIIEAVHADGEVKLRGPNGEQWQGQPDQRLTLRGRSDLDTAMRDLGRGKIDTSPAVPERNNDTMFLRGDLVKHDMLQGTGLVLGGDDDAGYDLQMSAVTIWGESGVRLARTWIMPAVELEVGDEVVYAGPDEALAAILAYVVVGLSDEAITIRDRWEAEAPAHDVFVSDLRVSHRVNVENARQDLNFPSGEPKVGPTQAEAVQALRTQFPLGTAVEFTLSGDEPGTTREYAGTLTAYEPGDSEYCRVEVPGERHTLVKLKDLRAAAAADQAEPVSDVTTVADVIPEPEPVADAPAQAVTPILADSSISMFRIEQLVASDLNPRKDFDPVALEELAVSILHKGLMQNLVGRIAENGQDVEVIAGGRRLRALKLLRESDRVPADSMVPVRVQVLSDLEALQLAVAENMERADIDPLQEADAFAQMVGLGATPQDLALRYGRSVQFVQQRLVLAAGLNEDGRKLYREGKIRLGEAQIIAQTTGPLRKHVVEAAERGERVSDLNRMIQRGSFLVEYAKFDVSASGLEIVQDLYHSQPARFADPKAALALQLDWVEARQKELTGKRGTHFVEVLKQDKSYLSLPYSLYTTYGAEKKFFGTVIMVSTVTGQVEEERAIRASDIRSAQAKQQHQERSEATAKASGTEGKALRKSGWLDGHVARATALRAALVGDHKRTVALTILSLLEAEPVSLRASLSHSQAVPILAGLDRLRQIDVQLSGALSVTGEDAPQKPLGRRFSYDSEGKEPYAYLQTLLTLSLEELLDIQSVLIAQAVGGWSSYDPAHAPYLFVSRLAADTGATVSFKLTDEHLKAYPRDRLLELAGDAGLVYIANDTGRLSTNKAIREAILVHADELHARGYVPPIVRFPAGDPVAAALPDSAPAAD